MLLWPARHAAKATALAQPALRDLLRRFVAGDEDTALLRGVLEEHLVVGALGEDVDGMHDVPAAYAQAFYDLLADVVVREKRESGHYFRWRLR